MTQAIEGIVRDGRIELLDQIVIPDGTRVLITPALEDDDVKFWQGVTEYSLREIWDNEEDDIYAELLKK